MCIVQLLYGSDRIPYVTGMTVSQCRFLCYWNLQKLSERQGRERTNNKKIFGIETSARDTRSVSEHARLKSISN